MARVTEITPETAEGEVAEVFSDSLRQFGRVSNFSQVMANAPAALQAWMTANRGVRMKYLKAGDWDFLRIEQMVIVKTSAVNGGRYCLGHNVDLGLEAGLTPEQIGAIEGEGWRESPLLDERQRTAVAWAEAVTKLTARDDDELFAALQAHFDDELFAALQAHFDDREIVELTVLCGMWN
ncbi:MAG: carboxymuconolactone decarboxylase family protein, partial [Gaiellaceae bacterium]